MDTANGEKSMSVAEKLENVYLTRRLEMVCEKTIATPIAVLQDMAKAFDTLCESEEFHFFLPEVREISWRVEMTVGQLKGMGEAPLRKLAAHMAAADILQQIKNSKDTDVPVYGLLPGCRISPNAFIDLAFLCAKLKLDAPKFFYEEKGTKKRMEDGPSYKVYCKVGDLVIRADSDSLILAKRLVARDMYETLSNELYPEYNIVNGKDCTRSILMEKFKLAPVAEYITDDIIDQIRKRREQEFDEQDPMEEDVTGTDTGLASDNE